MFAEYLNRLFWHTTGADAPPDGIPEWATKLTAVGAILLVFLVCAATPNAAPRLAVMFTTVKVRPPPRPPTAALTLTRVHPARSLPWYVPSAGHPTYCG